MNRLKKVREQNQRRKVRIRKVVVGTTQRPRLSVTISNQHVSVQVIDDSAHKTLLSSTTAGQKQPGMTLTEKATWVGKDIAAKAKKAKVTALSFDRNGRLYHGRVKALADAVREEGLEL